MYEKGELIYMSNYVVITGASSGIGYAAAKSFAKRGHNLIVVARREEKLLQLKNEIIAEYPGVDVVVRVHDLEKIDTLDAFYDELQAFKIDTWINNAGFGLLGDVKDNDEAKVLSMLRLNIEALTVFTMRFVRDHWTNENATLINVSSTAGYSVGPHLAAYTASKYYVSAYTESLIHEVSVSDDARMRVKCLAPGSTDSEFFSVATGGMEKPKGHKSNTSKDMAEFMFELYKSDLPVGKSYSIDFTNRLEEPLHTHGNRKK